MMMMVSPTSYPDNGLRGTNLSLGYYIYNTIQYGLFGPFLILLF